MNKDDIIKNEILENASKLFQKYGFNKTTVEDIAKASGKGKSSLYYYYKDKEEIFIAVFSKEANEILSFVSDKITHCSTAEEMLKTYIQTFTKEFSKYSNLYNIIFGEIGGNITLLKRLAEKFDEMQMKVIKKILEHGIKSGEFSLPRGIEATPVAYLIVSSLGSIQLDTIFSTSSKDFDLGNIMSWIFMDGLKKKSTS